MTGELAGLRTAKMIEPEQPKIYRACPEVYRERDLIDARIRKAIFDECINGGRWPLFLTGVPGCGKTCAGLCLLDYYGSRWFWTAGELADTLALARKGELLYRGGAKRGIKELWEDIKAYKCVCVDELGAREKVSDTAYDSIKTCLDVRDGRPAIYISNLSRDELKAVYDDRIVSRLSAGTAIKFPNKDRRITNG